MYLCPPVLASITDSWLCNSYYGDGCERLIFLFASFLLYLLVWILLKEWAISFLFVQSLTWSMNSRIFVIPWDKVHYYHLATRSTFRLAPASFWSAVTIWAPCWLSGPIGSWGLILSHSLLMLISDAFLRSAFLPGFWVPVIEEGYLETKFWVLGVFNEFSQLLLGFLSPDRNRR